MDFMWGYVMGQKSAAQASAFARSAGAADAVSSKVMLNDVDERVDRLLLLLEAMWSLLRDQGLSDEQLMAKVVELDEADGTADGRRTLAPATCRGCGSKVAVGLAICQFCGESMPDADAPGPFSQI